MILLSLVCDIMSHDIVTYNCRANCDFLIFLFILYIFLHTNCNDVAQRKARTRMPRARISFTISEHTCHNNQIPSPTLLQIIYTDHGFAPNIVQNDEKTSWLKPRKSQHYPLLQCSHVPMSTETLDTMLLTYQLHNHINSIRYIHNGYNPIYTNIYRLYS